MSWPPHWTFLVWWEYFNVFLGGQQKQMTLIVTRWKKALALSCAGVHSPDDLDWHVTIGSYTEGHWKNKRKELEQNGGENEKNRAMNNITLTKEESFSNICSFVFFYFLFLVVPELIVWAGPSCLAWNRHQHLAHTTSESQCGRFPHLETDFPVLPVLCWAADGFPPCLGSHNGLMWDLLQWDLLQTRCYYSAVEHETCEEGQGQRTWYSPSGGLGQKVCHLWTHEVASLGLCTCFTCLIACTRERKTAVLLGFIVKWDKQERGMIWPFFDEGLYCWCFSWLASSCMSPSNQTTPSVSELMITYSIFECPFKHKPHCYFDGGEKGKQPAVALLTSRWRVVCDLRLTWQLAVTSSWSAAVYPQVCLMFGWNTLQHLELLCCNQRPKSHLACVNNNNKKKSKKLHWKLNELWTVKTFETCCELLRPATCHRDHDSIIMLREGKLLMSPDQHTNQISSSLFNQGQLDLLQLAVVRADSARTAIKQAFTADGPLKRDCPLINILCFNRI